ncbi:MAG TPA: MoxR family ATPase, partial [Mycobacteriales bacterium]|nr:MoxR family ATPase [Mycobacteriales bacterium]
LTRLAVALTRRRGTAVTDWHAGLDAAQVALSGRVRLHESCPRPVEDVVRELYEVVFGAEPRSEPDTGPGGDAPGGA